MREVVFLGLSRTIRGSRTAILGPNGSGKATNHRRLRLMNKDLTMRSLATVLWSLVLLSQPLFSQNGIALRLDTTALNGYNYGVADAVPTSSGGTVVLLQEPGGTSLWKCDGSGVAQWRNRYSMASTTIELDIAPCLNGDVLLIGSSISAIGTDMIQPAYEIWRIDTDGDVVWYKYMEEEALFSFSGVLGHTISINENDDGDIFVMSMPESMGSHRISITKIDQAGEMLWSQQVGDPAAAMLFPCSNCARGTWLYPDPTGGCRITVTGSNMGEHTDIISLAADGSVQWSSKFTYLGSVSASATIPHVVDEDGTTIIMWLTTSSNGGMHIVYISDSGSLIKVDRYGLHSNCCSELDYDEGRLFVRFYDAIFTVDNVGEVLTGIGTQEPPSDVEFDYTYAATGFEVLQGRVTFTNDFKAFPNSSGLPWGSPGTYAFDFDGPTPCLAEPFTAAHDVLPNSIFDMTPMENITSAALSTTGQDLEALGTPSDLLAGIDLCASMTDVQENRAGLVYHLNTTVLGAGTALIVSADEPIQWSVVDTKGALVNTASTAGRQWVLPNTSLAPGTYILMGLDNRGGQVKPARFVVLD